LGGVAKKEGYDQEKATGGLKGKDLMALNQKETIERVEVRDGVEIQRLPQVVGRQIFNRQQEEGDVAVGLEKVQIMLGKEGRSRPGALVYRKAFQLKHEKHRRWGH